MVEVRAVIRKFLFRRRLAKALQKALPLPMTEPAQTGEAIATHRGEKVPVSELFEEEKEAELRIHSKVIDSVVIPSADMEVSEFMKEI